MMITRSDKEVLAEVATFGRWGAPIKLRPKTMERLVKAGFAVKALDHLERPKWFLTKFGQAIVEADAK